MWSECGGPVPPVALHTAVPDGMNSPEQHGKLMRRRPWRLWKTYPLTFSIHKIPEIEMKEGK